MKFFVPVRVGLLCLVLFVSSADALQQSAPAAPPQEGAQLVEEINRFYAAYWQAWQSRDLAGLEKSLADDFLLQMHIAGQGVVRLDKQAAVESARQFFAALGDRQAAWSHSVMALIPRGPDEAIVAVRSDFSWTPGSGQIELSLDVLRKGSDGRWRLLRKSIERTLY